LQPFLRFILLEGLNYEGLHSQGCKRNWRELCWNLKRLLETGQVFFFTQLD